MAMQERMEFTAGSVEHVREPAGGTQELLALEAVGTRHTCTDIYAGSTPTHKVLKKNDQCCFTSLKCTSSGVALECRATPQRTGLVLVPSMSPALSPGRLVASLLMNCV